MSFILTNFGGSVIAVERFGNILANHYKTVNFLIPDWAFCMSGDDIYMDYFSVLVAIDPQVRSKEGKYVHTLVYLDEVDELVKKAESGTLTDAEILILKEMD